MDEERHLLRHFLAALAYRTQKALFEAPDDFGTFRAAPDVRTPSELLHHMSSVLEFAVLGLRGEPLASLPALSDLSLETERFHAILQELSQLLEAVPSLRRETAERLLQGPLSDAMTHAGQLALLRRLAGSPVPPENFYRASIEIENVGPNQPRGASG